jgi:F-type H+-transporting ATPase subunit b
MALLSSDDSAAHGPNTEGDAQEALHTEVGVAETHEGGGLPQMDTSTYASQLFWLALTFTFLYVFLSRMILPRIGQVIEERRDRIARDLDKAAELQSNSEAALAAYEASLAEARSKAHALGQETRDRLIEETDAKKAAVEAGLAKKLSVAEGKIAETKERALASIKDVANDTAAAVVEHLLGESADAAAVTAAVDAELAGRKD